eukprot:752993-Hanusia_phi.AAC.4
MAHISEEKGRRRRTSCLAGVFWLTSTQSLSSSHSSSSSAFPPALFIPCMRFRGEVVISVEGLAVTA